MSRLNKSACDFPLEGSSSGKFKPGLQIIMKFLVFILRRSKVYLIVGVSGLIYSSKKARLREGGWNLLMINLQT